MTIPSKQTLLGDNQTFCMYPWIHMHVTPAGVAAPCCMAESCSTKEGLGDGRTASLMELVNSPKMNQLRLDMLQGKRNAECTKCYDLEDKNIKSVRKNVNEDFGHFFDNTVPHTNLDDGSLREFYMYFFDIRFSNICNFKCRTCGQEYSSQWEYENQQQNLEYATKFPKNTNQRLLKDVIDQIDHMSWAYFAGGEPLIMEEHYILLEEMIRKKRKDIRLRYSTNLSNLKFKDKDLLDLWRYFDTKVDVYASIDHYGERAEYIRHGTNWGEVESNIKKLIDHTNVAISFNTVYSLFNALTIDQFYHYLNTNNLTGFNGIGGSPKLRLSYSVYPMQSPMHLTTDMLPDKYREQARESAKRLLNKYQTYGYSFPFNETSLGSIQYWLNNPCVWDQHKALFKKEIARLDNVRNESFTKVFPELAGLLDL